MPAFYKSTVKGFLYTSSEQISGVLSERVIKAFAGDQSRQLVSWKKQIEILKAALRTATSDANQTGHWGILFEFPLLRLQRRLDVVVLAGCLVVVIEFKVGSRSYLNSDIQQVEDYALDLRDFHEASHQRTILPLLCATEAGTFTITPVYTHYYVNITEAAAGSAGVAS